MYTALEVIVLGRASMGVQRTLIGCTEDTMIGVIVTL
jgi:hypothetical protein